MLFAERLLFNDLGVGYVSSHTRSKNFLGSLIGMGVSAIASGIGAISSSKAAKAQRSALESQKASDDAWYRDRKNTHYLDTEAGQNVIRQARELLDRNSAKVSGAAAVGGATDAAAAQAKESANNAVGDMMANVAANDTARRDSADAQHRQDEKQYTAQQMEIEKQKAAGITNAAQNFSNTASSIASVIGKS